MSLGNNDLPLHNFGPRVGFAYQPFGSESTSVIRGGYGVFYTLPNGEFGAADPWQPAIRKLCKPYGRRECGRHLPDSVHDGTYTWRLAATLSQLHAFGDRRCREYRFSMVQQYNLDVEQQLPSKFVLEVSYVGTRGTRLAESRALNRAYLASPQNPINGVTTNSVASANLQARVPYQGFTQVG